jgi:hypothetical protein
MYFSYTRLHYAGVLLVYQIEYTQLNDKEMDCKLLVEWNYDTESHHCIWSLGRGYGGGGTSCPGGDIMLSGGVHTPYDKEEGQTPGTETHVEILRGVYPKKCVVWRHNAIARRHRETKFSISLHKVNKVEVAKRLRSPTLFCL